MKNDTNHPFSMKFDMRMIDQLGLRLYQTLPPVISELVSNSWDADASVVDITIPVGVINHESKIIVKDNGIGMNSSELNDNYLSIGRCRREDNPLEKTPKGRPVMGRKGIGKLSVFGVADGVVLDTVKGGLTNSFKMLLSRIRSTSGQEYYPEPICVNKETTCAPGTSVLLMGLKRSKKINIDEICTQLSKRFSILSTEFQIKINGRKIDSFLDSIKNDIEEKYEFSEDLDNDTNYHVSGWIVTLKKPNDGAGITIMAHGKMVQEPFFFGEPMGRHFAYSYMVGVINADFLDEQNEDITATDRRSVSWDDTDATVLFDWGLSKISEIRKNWDTCRTKKKRKEIFNNDKIDKWYNKLGVVERELVDKIIKMIVESNVNDTKIVGLVEAISDRFDYEVYWELVERFNKTLPKDFNKVLDLINEWSFIEARDTLKVVKGRLSMIGTLKKFVETNDYEKTIQEHLFSYPWLIHPTFISWEKEVGLTTLLEKKYPAEDLRNEKKRVDILCLGTGSDVYVIELKRASVKLDYDDITQLKRYMSTIETSLSTTSCGPGNHPALRVFGYLIGGSISNDSLTSSELDRLRLHDIALMTYRELIDRAERMHSDFIDDLEKSTSISIQNGNVPFGKRTKKGNLKDYETD